MKEIKLILMNIRRIILIHKKSYKKVYDLNIKV